MSHYNIEGVDVFKTDYSQMRSIIMSKRYDAILVHFFDSEYAYYLDTSYIEDIPIIFGIMEQIFYIGIVLISIHHILKMSTKYQNT